MAMDPMPAISVFIPQNSPIRACEQESDGALFWKITHGKKPMPAYESRLSPTERWNVINYLRTLNK